MRKGTSEEGTQAWTERRKEGREDASGGRREQRSEGEEKGRSVGGREIGMDGNFKGGTLRRTLASIQYTAVSAQNNTQRGPCHCYFGITGIINSVL